MRRALARGLVRLSLIPLGTLGVPLSAQEAAEVVAQDPAPLPLGERLLSDRNCTACHAASGGTLERLAPKSAPRLADVASRVTPSYLEAFLADPVGVKSWTTMPDACASLPEGERARAIDELVAYLGTLGEPLDPTAAEGVRADELEAGRQLFHSIGCVACHSPQEEPWELGIPLLELWEEEAAASDAEDDESDLEYEDDELYVRPGTLEPSELDLQGFLARKTTVAALTRFLVDPLAVRPSGHMPNLALDDTEARAIAVYLLRDQLREQGGPAYAPGLLYAYFERDGGAPNFETDEPVRTGVADDFSIADRNQNDHFGFTFEGLVDVPEDGDWTFSTRSDDGSFLWIDGELVVDNGGTHPPRRIEGTRTLVAGRHAIRVTMFEQGGGELLEVCWRGPDMLSEQPIPASSLSHVGLAFAPVGGARASAAPDATLVEAGRRRFVELGCPACHSTGEAAIDGAAPGAKGPRLKDLGGLEGDSCLAPKGASTPARWALDEAELAALRDQLAAAGDLGRALEPRVAVEHRLDRLRCYQCHRRDDIGGVHPARSGYYLANEEAELGDESRFPPHLTGVGAKLRRDALAAVLLEGDGVRPYITARMPDFGAANVEPLVDAFAAVDLGGVPEAPVARTDISPEEIDAGQVLLGRNGLGCIQCHDFGGVPSLGVRAVDMERMYERYRPDWFATLLADPKAVEMNSRMAELFVDGKSPAPDVLGGDPAKQIDVVWRYLSLGGAMPYPEGLVTPDSAYELTPVERVLTCGVFLRGESPRSVMVGFPERVHYAFDVQSSRLAKMWRGRFFNARGTWEGRAGQLEGPASDDVLEAPPGMHLARLASQDTAWPRTRGEEAGFRPRGRVLDPDGRPTWRYEFAGVVVTDAVEPIVRVGGGWLRRTLELEAPPDAAPADLYLRLAVGDGVELQEDGSWEVTGSGVTQRLRILDGEAVVRVVPGGLDGATGAQQELLMKIAFEAPAGDGEATRTELGWEVTW